MFVTYQTRLPDGPASPVLGAFGHLQGRIERSLHAEAMKGRKWRGDLQVSFYQPFGVSSAFLWSCWSEAEAKRKSATEAAKVQSVDLAAKVDTKARQVKAKEIALAKAHKGRDKARAAMDRCETRFAKASPKASGALFVRYGERFAEWETHRAEMSRLRHDLHQHRRRLDVLTLRRAGLEARAGRPSICFGSRKLFNAQFDLKANGLRSHAEWLGGWHDARSGNVYLEGDASHDCGNAFVTGAVAADGSLTLTLRLPEALAHLADRTEARRGSPFHLVDLHGVRFPRKGAHASVAKAVVDGTAPVTWRFVHDAVGWRAMASIAEAMPEAAWNVSLGVLGIDLNVDHVAATWADASGNLRRTWRFPLCTYGKDSDQAADMTRKVARAIARLSATLGLPIAAERLDFAKRKASLTLDHGPRRARILSSLAYSAFGAALDRACAREGVALRRVNPAHTSTIGRIAFARRLGLSVHHAAALVIARRAMRHAEGVPETLELAFEDGDRVALPRPDGIGRRHVWSSWSRVHRSVKAALAAHARSRQRPPSARPTASAVGPAVAGSSQEGRASAGGIPVSLRPGRYGWAGDRPTSKEDGRTSSSGVVAKAT